MTGRYYGEDHLVYKQENRDFHVIVAEPDRSADWHTNKIVLIMMCALSDTIALFSKGEETSLGEFLNRNDALELLALLKARVSVGNHSSRAKRDF
jgi:hypothetical protein